MARDEYTQKHGNVLDIRTWDQLWSLKLAGLTRDWTLNGGDGSVRNIPKPAGGLFWAHQVRGNPAVPSFEALAANITFVLRRDEIYLWTSSLAQYFSS